MWVSKVISIGVILLIALLSTAALAEGISGLVRDQQGGVLPGVTVTIENVDTALTRTVVSSDTGRYEATNLPLGNYAITASLPGFKTIVRSGIELTVGQDVVVGLTLELGEITEEVVVTGEAPLVQTRSAVVSGLVDSRAIRDLPLNGRSFDELITLHGGTAVFRTVQNSASQGFANKFSVSGQRSGSNKFYQDGTELSGSSRIADLPGSAAGVNLGVEAIREFRVLTSSFSPQYGKKAGGAIITVTKSGTNAYHGSLFYFHRNSELDAQNFFAVGKDPFKRHSFGASIGGPIAENKTFFFFNYEGLREGLSTPFSEPVPDADARQGILAGQNLGLSPKTAPYMDMWPLPNANLNFGDGTAAFEHAPSRTAGEDFILGRLDHTLSESQSIFGSYTFSDADTYVPTDNPFFAETNATRNQRLTLQHTLIATARLVNTFRVGYYRSYHIIENERLKDFSSLETFIPGEPLGSIEIPGLMGTGGTQGGTFGAKNSFQFSDQIAYTLGNHSLEFGIEVQRTHLNEDAADRKRGAWDFRGLDDLITNDPRRFRGIFPLSASGELINIGIPLDINYIKGWRQTYFATYIRDQFSLTDNVNLDLGLRYEVATAPTEVNGRFSNSLVEEIEAPFFRRLSPSFEIGDQAWSTKWLGFAPRVGLAWDIGGEGMTTVRAGFGVFYDQIDNDYRFYNHINPPFSPRAETPGGDVSALFPNPFELLATNELRTSGRSIDPFMDVPTALHYNLTLEQQLGTQNVFRVSYVGSTGYHLIRATEVNLRIPTIVDGKLFFDRRTPFAQPLFGQWDLLMTNANSHYNSLRTELETRFGQSGLLKRFRGKVAYTWAKSIDDASTLQSSSGNNTRSKMIDQFDTRRDRGLSAFHFSHLFTFNFTYNLANLPLQGVAGALFNNWMLNGIGTFSSGYPINVEAGFNVSRTGQGTVADRPDLIAGGDNSLVLGGPNRYFDTSQFSLPEEGFIGNLGRNTLIGPGVATFDGSLVRDFPVSSVSEEFRIQLRLEFFNLFNRTNFNVPEKRIFNSNGSRRGSAGRITSTTTTNRQIQFGLKIIF